MLLPQHHVTLMASSVPNDNTQSLNLQKAEFHVTGCVSAIEFVFKKLLGADKKRLGYSVLCMYP